jgi:hypothetical protein
LFGVELGTYELYLPNDETPQRGELLVGLAAAQLAGEDFWVGLDRQRADAAGQQLVPVPELAATTAAGLAPRFPAPQWAAVETGLGDVHAAALVTLAAVTPTRAAALAEDVTIDLDTTDVEVYGRHKRGVAYNHQGQRVARPHVATRADTATVLALSDRDLLAGNEDPRRGAAELLGCALAALPAAARGGRIRLRADAGYFAGQLARAALAADVTFAIGARRIRLDRRDQHGGRAGRRRRLHPRLVHPGLVAGGDPAADPPGPPRGRRRCGVGGSAGPPAAHPSTGRSLCEGGAGPSGEFGQGCVRIPGAGSAVLRQYLRRRATWRPRPPLASH